MRKRTKRNLTPAPNRFAPRPTIAPEPYSLATPSELQTAPSDFEHVFHAQQASEMPDNKAKEIQNKKEKERKDREAIFKIFKLSKTKDPNIPVYATDEKGLPNVINVSLTNLVELNQQFQRDRSSNTQINRKMPTITFFHKKEIPQMKQVFEIETHTNA